MCLKKEAETTTAEIMEHISRMRKTQLRLKMSSPFEAPTCQTIPRTQRIQSHGHTDKTMITDHQQTQRNYQKPGNL